MNLYIGQYIHLNKNRYPRIVLNYDQNICWCFVHNLINNTYTVWTDNKIEVEDLLDGE